MDAEVKKEFAEDIAKAMENLFVEIGGRALEKSLQTFSEEHGRRSKELGKIQTETQQAQTLYGSIQQNITGKKAEAQRVTAELQELQAEKERREASVSLLLEEEKRLQARLESLRHTLAQESRA